MIQIFILVCYSNAHHKQRNMFQFVVLSVLAAVATSAPFGGYLAPFGYLGYNNVVPAHIKTTYNTVVHKSVAPAPVAAVHALTPLSYIPPTIARLSVGVPAYSAFPVHSYSTHGQFNTYAVQPAIPVVHSAPVVKTTHVFKSEPIVESAAPADNVLEPVADSEPTDQVAESADNEETAQTYQTAQAPVFQSTSEVIHETAPVYHAAASVYHAAAPFYHAAAPVFHAAAPVYQATAPVYQAPAPVYHAAAPVVENSRTFYF